MMAQVADEVGDDLTVGEAPAAVDALEAIVVAPGDDRLERQVGAGLQIRPGLVAPFGLNDALDEFFKRPRAFERSILRRVFGDRFAQR